MNDSREIEALAPLLRLQIMGYEEMLNIVERPSVGLLDASPKICTLIHNVLGYSLSSLTARQVKDQAGTKVSVRCGRLTPSNLVLEVVADRAWRPANMTRTSWMMQKFDEDTRRFNGMFATGDVSYGPGRPALHVYFHLIVPAAA